MRSFGIYVHFDPGEHVDCICMQSRKKCNKRCSKETVYYDEFNGLLECIKHNSEVRY